MVYISTRFRWWCCIFHQVTELTQIPYIQSIYFPRSGRENEWTVAIVRHLRCCTADDQLLALKYNHVGVPNCNKQAWAWTFELLFFCFRKLPIYLPLHWWERERERERKKAYFSLSPEGGEGLIEWLISVIQPFPDQRPHSFFFFFFLPHRCFSILAFLYLTLYIYAVASMSGLV